MARNVAHPPVDDEAAAYKPKVDLLGQRLTWAGLGASWEVVIQGTFRLSKLFRPVDRDSLLVALLALAITIHNVSSEHKLNEP